MLKAFFQAVMAVVAAAFLATALRFRFKQAETARDAEAWRPLNLD